MPLLALDACWAQAGDTSPTHVIGASVFKGQLFGMWLRFFILKHLVSVLRMRRYELLRVLSLVFPGFGDSIVKMEFLDTLFWSDR